MSDVPHFFDEYDVATPLQDLRAEFYGSDEDSLDLRDLMHYARTERIDLNRLWLEHGIVVRIKKARWFAGPRFEFSEEYSSHAVVMEALDEDRETVVDLVAWPQHRPEKFGTALGRAHALGMDMVANPATYHLGTPLHVFRTPLEWLRADCQGCVILNAQSAPRWLGEALGKLAAADIDHGRQLARLLHPFFPPDRILVPTGRREAA